MARVIRPQALRHAAAVADRAVESGSHPCAVLAAANAQHVFWTHVASGQDTAREETIFLLASITKPILATAVMQMVERGRLLLGAPVASILPAFDASGKGGVTVRHLLTHTSGLDETAWLERRLNGESGGPTCLEMACSTHLRFAPGTRCEYCSLSFAALAGIVEQLAGVPYDRHLADEVLQPAGMVDTGFAPVEPQRAAPVRDFGEAALASFLSRKIAGGGLWSTAADLVRFGQEFLRAGPGGSTYDDRASDVGNTVLRPRRNLVRLCPRMGQACGARRCDVFAGGLWPRRRDGNAPLDRSRG